MPANEMPGYRLKKATEVLAKKDIVLGLSVFAFGVLLYLQSSGIRDMRYDILGPSFIPKLASLSLMVFGLILFATSLRKNKEAIKKNAKPEGISQKTYVFLAITIVFMLLFGFLGFFVASVFFILANYMLMAAKMSVRQLAVGLVFSVASTWLIFMLFTEVFNLMLP